MGGFGLLVELHREGSALQPTQQACSNKETFIRAGQGRAAQGKAKGRGRGHDWACGEQVAETGAWEGHSYKQT